MKLNTKTGAIITLVVCGGVYVLMLTKGQKPPAGLDQVIVAAAAALFISQDAADEKVMKKTLGNQK
jgi:hypothetical protein